MSLLVGHGRASAVFSEKVWKNFFVRGENRGRIVNLDGKKTALLILDKSAGLRLSIKPPHLTRLGQRKVRIVVKKR